MNLVIGVGLLEGKKECCGLCLNFRDIAYQYISSQCSKLPDILHMEEIFSSEPLYSQAVHYHLSQPFSSDCTFFTPTKEKQFRLPFVHKIIHSHVTRRKEKSNFYLGLSPYLPYMDPLYSLHMKGDCRWWCANSMVQLWARTEKAIGIPLKT